MKRHVTAIVALVVMLSACGGDTDEVRAPVDTLAHEGKTASLDTTATGVHVQDLEYSRLPGGARVLTGRLVNPTERYVRNAQVQVSLYDDDNRAIGTMIIVVQDVPPSDERAFREPVEQEGAAGARVRGIMAQ